MADGGGGGQPAGSGTQHCPTLAEARPPNAPPCDLKTIVAKLETRQKTITVHNGERSAVKSPPVGVTKAEADLLQKYAVVIIYALDYHGAGKDGGQDHSETSMAPYRLGLANAQVVAPQRCDIHPIWSSTKKEGAVIAGEVGALSKHVQLKIETVEFSASAFVKKLIHWKLDEFTRPAASDCTIDFLSCGWPAHGDPVGELTAYVGMRALDAWTFTFRWGSGFHMTFGKTSTRTTEHGERTSEDSRYATVGNTKVDSKSTTVTKDGSVVSSSSTSSYSDGSSPTSPKSGSIQSKDAAQGGSQSSTATKSDPDKVVVDDSANTSGDGSRWRKSTEAADEKAEKKNDAIQEKLESIGKGIDSLTKDDGFDIEILRNGVSQLDLAELAETIESIKSFLNKALELIHRINLLVNTAMKVGFPVSFTYALSLDIKVLEGSFEYSRRAERKEPLVSGSYYLARYEASRDVTAHLRLLDGKGEISFEFEAKVIHSWVASFDVTGSVKWRGFFGLRFETGEKNVPMEGMFWVTIAVSGSVNAATFYVKATCSATSGISWLFNADIEEEQIRVKKNELRSKRVTFQLNVCCGNKIQDKFKVGDEGFWHHQWPEDHAYVLVEEGYIDDKF